MASDALAKCSSVARQANSPQPQAISFIGDLAQQLIAQVYQRILVTR